MSSPRKATGQASAVLPRLWRKFSGGLPPFVEQPTSAEDLSEQMAHASVPSFGFFFMLALAAAIATFGLIANSAPAIIGAMIIAPLMSPILSLSYGLVTFNRQTIGLSIITVIAGTTLVVAIAYIVMLIFGMRVAGSEILSRAASALSL